MIAVVCDRWAREPVQALAAIERDFEAAEEQRNQRESNNIDAKTFAQELLTLLFESLWLLNENADKE